MLSHSYFLPPCFLSPAVISFIFKHISWLTVESQQFKAKQSDKLNVLISFENTDIIQTFDQTVQS